MSLINEMLHDLEDGRARQDKTSAADPALSDSGLLNSHSSSTWIPGAIAFVVVGSLLLLQQFNGDKTVEREDVAQLDVDSSKAADIDKPAEKTLLAPNYYPKLMSAMTIEESADLASSTNIGSATLDVNQQSAESDLPETREKKISELLTAASKSFALDRLLSPAEDNACDRYREILLLEPNHPQAIIGLESVANRYINLAKDYADNDNMLRAKVLLRRAESVMPESAIVRQNIEQARQYLLAIQTQEDVQLTPLQKGSLATQVQLIETHESEVIKPSNLADQKFVRSSSDEWRDLSTARKAKKLLSKGYGDEALASLRAFIDAAPESPHSLDLLLHTLIDKGYTGEAQKYLLAAKHLDGSDITQYNAHILVASNNISEAIMLLETQLPNANENYSYQVLLAGLYHREGNYTDSVEVYRRLLREHENKSEYWLGLAVSLDSLNRDDEALKAFISAKDSTQNKQVQRYITARIQALTNKANANRKLQSQTGNLPS